MLTRFFSGPFDKCIIKLRYVWVGVFIVLGIVGAVIASRIGPLTKQEEWLPDDNEIIMLSNEVNDNFSKAVEGFEQTIWVHLNWGVKDLDREGVSSWDPEDVGKLVWDDNFTVTPEANQRSIMELCNGLKTNKELVKD